MRARWRSTAPFTDRARDAGQAALLMMIGALVMATIALVIVATVGRGVTDAARARTAADAAALAAALGGRPRAEALASANGGHVVDYRDSDGTVEVTVVVGRARARATASLEMVIGSPADRDAGPGTYTPPRAG
ncbi:MAG: pilus assembly protein TadG-related protein [Acidimicrobiia bacterium]